MSVSKIIVYYVVYRDKILHNYIEIHLGRYISRCSKVTGSGKRVPKCIQLCLINYYNSNDYIMICYNVKYG